MNYSAISVVMATYNGERFLVKQLDSILAQTLRPAEIIVCDDRSTDNTVAILEQYRKSHGIRYYINEKTLGVVGNFKKAVSLAAEENYIALSDQDDIWLPEKLALSLNALSVIDDGKSPAMIYSDLIVVDQDDNMLSPSLNNELGFDKYQHSLSTLLFGNFVLGCTVMMNRRMRELFNDIPVGHSFNHDAWITLIAFTFGRVALVKKPIILYRKHTQNVTFSNHKKSKRINRIMNHIRSLFLNTTFLQEQIHLLTEFHVFYKNMISEAHSKTIMNVIQLEKKSYLQKKLAFERSFSGNWIKRF